MKIRTKILIPPAVFMAILVVMLIIFFITLVKQDKRLTSISSDLQEVSNQISQLTKNYFEKRNNLIHFIYGKKETYFNDLISLDNDIDEKFQQLSKSKYSQNILKDVNQIININNELITVQKELHFVFNNDKPKLNMVVDKYTILLSKIEAALADISTYLFYNFNQSLSSIREDNSKFKPLIMFVSIISLILLVIVLVFYNKNVIKPIFQLTDAAWKIAQGYYENKPNIQKRNDEIGQLTLAFSVMTDNLIAANEDLEEKVRQRTEDLERSNADLEHFAYIASHDLQEPLRMVASYTELLAARYKGQLDEKAEKYIDYAVDGAKRMQTMIRGLLEYSRAGTDELTTESTELSNLLDIVLHDLKSKIEEHSVNIKIDQMPMLSVNRQQIGRVFQNMLTNAIKFRNAVSPKISITVNNEKEEYIFCVHDNGVGIDSESIDRIFNLFERVHSRKKYEGNGIGLAVSKRLIENHGGRMWVESNVNHWTKFYFTLPRGECSDALDDDSVMENACTA